MRHLKIIRRKLWKYKKVFINCVFYFRGCGPPFIDAMCSINNGTYLKFVWSSTPEKYFSLKLCQNYTGKMQQKTLYFVRKHLNSPLRFYKRIESLPKTYQWSLSNIDWLEIMSTPSFNVLESKQGVHKFC